MTNTQTVNL